MARKLIFIMALGIALAGCQHVEVANKPSLAPAVPAHLAKIVKEKADKHAVPAELAAAVTHTESKWQPRIRGRAGEYGLMQIKCPTARGEGFQGSCRELFDPGTNAEFGVRYLRRALETANGDWCHAATLYNRGVYAAPRRSQYCDKVVSLAREFAPAID